MIKSNKHLNFSLEDFLLVLAVFILFFMLGLSWFFNPNNLVSENKVRLSVIRGMNLTQLADSLKNKKLIDSKFAFLIAGKFLNAERTIKAGIYEIPYGLSNYEYLKIFVRGNNRISVRITLYEGTTLKQLANQLSKVFPFSEEDFLKAASDSILLKKYEIDNSNFEGYFLPDTYDFFLDSYPKQIIERMASAFKEFYDKSIKPHEPRLNLTKNQIVTLASIIEGETNYNPEKKTIAGVYLNRLKHGMKLQADPTIAYLIDDGPRRILYKDLKIFSPYNTYLNYGLPPGPINFPDRSSLLAVINAEKHNYFYFVMKPDGQGHNFSRNYREHLVNVRLYRNSLKKR